jgi:hypothetical protein
MSVFAPQVLIEMRAIYDQSIIPFSVPFSLALRQLAFDRGSVAEIGRPRLMDHTFPKK